MRMEWWAGRTIARKVFTMLLFERKAIKFIKTNALKTVSGESPSLIYQPSGATYVQSAALSMSTFIARYSKANLSVHVRRDVQKCRILCVPI